MKKKIFSYLALASILPTMTMQANESISEFLNRIHYLQRKLKAAERNVMLNAADATKPREIQIGLPSEDVNVYENGLACSLLVCSTQTSVPLRSSAQLR